MRLTFICIPAGRCGFSRTWFAYFQTYSLYLQRIHLLWWRRYLAVTSAFLERTLQRCLLWKRVDAMPGIFSTPSWAHPLDLKRRVDCSICSKRAMRNTPDTTFNYTALRGESKREVLEALLAEQGHLCAYCTCRIGVGDRLATIEHLFPHFCFVGLVLPECIP